MLSLALISQQDLHSHIPSLHGVGGTVYSLASQSLSLPPLAPSSCFTTRTCSMTCQTSRMKFAVLLNACQSFVLPQSHSYPFSQALQWFTTGCPTSRGEHLSHHKKPFPICAWCKECLSYLQSHQELTNSLREERDETPQPSYCLIYNPFMTKKEYCIHKTQEVVQGKLPLPQLSFLTRFVSISESWWRQM